MTDSPKPCKRLFCCNGTRPMGHPDKPLPAREVDSLVNSSKGIESDRVTAPAGDGELDAALQLVEFRPAHKMDEAVPISYNYDKAKAAIQQLLAEARREGARTPILQYDETTAIAVKRMCEDRIAELQAAQQQDHTEAAE